MITFPTDNLFIEGPDLSGKTTLIKNIHSKTNYRWHITDRSKISRMIFAEMFNRDTKNLKKDFLYEASNLNNRYIFILPSLSVIKERYSKRGDEIHTLESLEESYELFHKAFVNFSRLSNVHGLICDTPERAEDLSINYANAVESLSLSDIINYVQMFAKRFPGNECNTLRFKIRDDCSFSEADYSVMRTKGEESYYSRILESTLRKIDHELSGINEYSRIEDESSRRFIFTDDTCISMIHALNRDGVLDIRFVCRSTDMIRKFPNDIRFLYYVASKIWEKIGNNCATAELHFTLNSAHIIQ